MKCTLTNNTQNRTLPHQRNRNRSVTEHTIRHAASEREHERCRPQQFIYARAAGDVQADSPASEAGAGEGEGGAGEGQQGSHEEEVVEGGSGAGVPVIKPAPVYNKEGVVVEVTQDIVDAVDKFTPPAGFVRKGSRDKSYMYSVGVYVEHTESRRTDHKYYCLAHSKCRRSSKVIPCKRGDRSNVNTHLKTAHNMQGTAAVVKAGNKQSYIYL